MFLDGHHGQISKYLVVLVAEMHEKWPMAACYSVSVQLWDDRGLVVTLSKIFGCWFTYKCTCILQAA